VGGHIEAIPFFLTILCHGCERACVAFCNDRGKLDELAMNETATALWAQAVRREHHDPAVISDYLAGPVVVLLGDPEFLGAL
jgi:hypothetical protein